MQGRFNGRVVGQDYTGRNARHNGRAGVYNAVQSAFGPSLDITLANGLSSLFTYTRATTATVPDFEPLIESCLSGELRIQGARRVRNGLAAPENSGAWTVINSGTITTGATDPNGGTTAFQLDMPTENGTFSSSSNIRLGSIANFVSSGDALLPSFYVKGDAAGTTYIQDSVFGSFLAVAIPVTTEWKRVTLSAAATAAGNQPNLAFGRVTGGLSRIYVWHPQMENVTGQSNQNPSEYVSVGVLSSPYHGYFADGVKYFSYENGNTVSSNVVTEAQGAALTGTIGYLPEGARTNIWTYSQQAFATQYTAQNITVTDSAATAWTGATASATLRETATSAVHRIFKASGTAYTANAQIVSWAVVTPVGRDYVQMVMQSSSGSIQRANFRLSTATMVSFAVTGSSTITNGGVTALSGGRYLVWVTGVLHPTDVSFNNCFIGPADADYAGADPSYAGDITKGMNLDAWQVEYGAFPSSYIPTTTAAVARNGDVLSAPSAGILNSAAMTIAIRWAPTAASQGTVFLFGTYVDANNYTAILHDGTNIIARKRIGGANHDATKALAYTKDTVYRITARFDGTNGCDIWVDGVKGTNDSTTTAAQVGTNFQMGCDGNSANHSFAVIPTLKAYRSGLSDAQAAAL